MRKSWKLMLALLAIFGMIAAACGGDDDDSSSGSSSDSSSSSSSSSSSDDGGAAEEASSGDLATCPDPLVIQTDWFPESEHGAMYELFGSGAYSIDAENLIVSGTLHDGATDTGIGLEVRTGGPAIGFSPVASYMYTDSGITLGYANTEAQVTFFESAPLLSVVAPLEKNPQMVMWDPATYPDVNSLKDLGDAGITISVFGGGVFAEVFIAQGIWSADQVDPSYDGSPANFIANGGTIAQQGFASAEPYDYENVFTDWGKPVKLQLLHDAGFPVYSQTIAIRSAEKDALDECLKALVPVIQRATVSFVTNPDTANGIIIDAVETSEASGYTAKDSLTSQLTHKSNSALLVMDQTTLLVTWKKPESKASSTSWITLESIPVESPQQTSTPTNTLTHQSDSLEMTFVLTKLVSTWDSYMTSAVVEINHSMTPHMQVSLEQNVLWEFHLLKHPQMMMDQTERITPASC
ncbi:MAG: hypothetical protein Ct9H90mP5_01600 [Acidimicrobiaceae bacterium]|nr:MAG: hypothetical protein Ct9H90mP5_01600 [Acidimicrobiaceae bacterium]